jgi:hypothetical protein
MQLLGQLDDLLQKYKTFKKYFLGWLEVLVGFWVWARTNPTSTFEIRYYMKEID